MRVLTAAAPLILAAGPALAATGPFFSLRNTDFVVLLGFIVFVGVVLYMKVPGKITGMLDDRAAGIRRDLDEARALREEAQTVLASYERKTREAHEQAEAIVTNARREAEAAAAQARTDLDASVARRMSAAEEQIDSARASAVRAVRNEAVTVATAAAAEVVAKQMTAADQNRLIDQSIDTVAARLH